MSGKLEFPGVLFHQFFKALKRDNFLQRDMDRLGPGLYAKNFCCFISEVRVEPD
jgi:hypothetical protein